MKIKVIVAMAAGLGLGLGLIGSATADDSDGGLAGRVFAVQAELRLSLDPTYPPGSVFDSCFYFNEDGTWLDPLWPDVPADAVPGVWFQHAEHPKIAYTATVPASPATFDLLYIQQGLVWPNPANGRQKLHAYSSAWYTDPGSGQTFAVFELEIRGEAVDECPYF